VVIDNFDTPGMAVLPGETHAPLVVDADAVLADAISLQGFQPITATVTQCRPAKNAIPRLPKPLLGAIPVRGDAASRDPGRAARLTFLLVIYAKAVRGDIPAHLLKAIKETIDHE
jgi:hypothetical protein